MRTKLLLTGLLSAAVFQGAWAGSIPCSFGTNASVPVGVNFSNGVQDGNYLIQLTLTQGAFACGGQTWQYRYDYDITYLSTTLTRPSFLLEVRIPSGSQPFCAVPAPAILSGAGGNPAAWVVNQGLSGGVDPIDWHTGGATTNGMAIGSTWRFTVFSNSPPLQQNIELDASYCPRASDLATGTLAAGFVNYCTPSGTAPIPPPTEISPQLPVPVIPPIFIPGACPPRMFNVAEAYPATPQAHVGFTSGCWVGGSTVPLENLTPPRHVTVPGVLCLATDSNTHLLDLHAFIDPACCASPTVQNIKLVKVIPGSQKCPDTYPPITYTQLGSPRNLTAIRTWWPLMYSMPGTQFTLTLRGVCHGRLLEPFQDTWVWTVVANPQTFRYVIDWLHTSEINLLEVPCIVGEDTYLSLVACADILQATVNALQLQPGNSTLRSQAQDAVFSCESFVLCSALFADVVNQQFPFDYSGTEGPGFPQGPPPNMAQPAPAQFPTQCGTVGILDSFENPCACKLITDLENISNQLQPVFP